MVATVSPGSVGICHYKKVKDPDNEDNRDRGLVMVDVGCSDTDGRRRPSIDQMDRRGDPRDGEIYKIWNIARYRSAPLSQYGIGAILTRGYSTYRK